MMAPLAVHCGHEPARLRPDRGDQWIEVSHEKPGQLQTTLVDHVTAHGGGPEAAGQTP